MSAGAVAALAAVAGVWVALYVAHHVGDHWAQTPVQALRKGLPGLPGVLACARHVAVLTVLKAVSVASLALVTGWCPSPVSLAAGLAVEAASHYWADRRATLAALAERVGKGEFHGLGDGATAPCGTGAYALDQSWHIGWAYAAALIISL